MTSSIIQRSKPHKMTLSFRRLRTNNVGGRLIVSATLALFICEARADSVAGRVKSRAQALVQQEFGEIKEALQKVSATTKSDKEQISFLTNKLSTLQLISGTDGESQKEQHREMFPGLDSDFDTFKGKLRSVTMSQTEDGVPSLDGKGDADRGFQPVKYYIVEEDLLLDELGLLLYHQQAKALATGQSGLSTDPAAFKTTFTSADSSALRLIQTPLRAATEEGHIVRWIPGSTLKYCVLRWTFGGDRAKYEQVVKNMQAACRNWADTCNMKFEYVQQCDGVPRGTVFPTANDGQRQVLFVVVDKEIDAIASSFFPNDSISQRLLIINPKQYFQDKIDMVGILRHELGHVLGFRHEHISPNAPVWTSAFCKRESAEASQNITSYDRASVMHYPCESDLTKGPLPANLKLEITELDRKGAQSVYGAPGANPPSGDRFRDFDPVR